MSTSLPPAKTPRRRHLSLRSGVLRPHRDPAATGPAPGGPQICVYSSHYRSDPETMTCK